MLPGSGLACWRLACGDSAPNGRLGPMNTAEFLHCLDLPPEPRTSAALLGHILSRALLKVVYHLLRTGTSYDPAALTAPKPCPAPGRA
jgi:hypothetical protein